ncbi:(2Fe-2S)-binding protein, partial [Oharaeibacter diazotrophicus]
GRAAARAALARLGRDVPAAELPVVDAAPTEAYRLAWMDAMTAAGGPDVEICRCEEVTRAELLGVRPPRYLGADAAPCPPLERLAEDGTPSPDQLKRLTRAGMGVCQGRRCREQVAMATALATGTPLARLPLAGYRAPVRPLPLAAIADRDETPAMTADWDVWFGIPTQWVPYDDIGTEREDAFLGRNMHL